MLSSFSKHIAEDIWGDFVEERVSAETAAQIQAHLETGCERCIGQQEQWQGMLSALGRSRTATPPAAVLQRAFDLFVVPAPRPSLLERIVASLTFDSRNNLMPAVARASTGVSFNMVYTADDTSVYLWCEYNGLNWQVSGQVSSNDAFQSVRALGGATPFQIELDEEGEFRLPDLASGRYDLVIPGTTQEVFIPAVDLSPS